MLKWILIFSPSFTLASEGVIESTEIHQYECRQGQASSHYFYANHISPTVKPSSDTDSIQCHDADTYGPVDSVQAGRLNDRSTFSLWSIRDTRFIDANNDKKIDLHQEIDNKLLQEHGEKRSTSLFHAFKWPSSPFDTKPNTLGYIMRALTHAQTKQSFCPGPEHFKGNDPLMKVLGDYVNYATQALYVGKRKAAANEVISETGPDYILISESQLKEATFLDATKNYFRLDQEEGVFQLVEASQVPSDYGLSNVEAGSSDKRIGCIPL